MFFTGKNRKKNLIISFLTLFLFSGVIFAFSNIHPAHAFLRLSDGTNVMDDCAPFTSGWVKCMTSGGDVSNVGDNIVVTAFKWLLYAIFTVFGWMASVAITLFEWVIKPENISGKTGVLNQPVVYEMWKFIRDFFNLFFILVLLYVAFKIVFQIEHDFKKTLLSIVLAALFINFSYPVTRVLIDVTNVPMYFFANQMAAKAGGGTDVFSQAMSASQIKGILIPGAENGGSFNSSQIPVARLLVAIIFMFLFSITLLVLAVMFVVRLVALVVLVIFSSVGFAASIVPGLSSYADMWWKNFWKYAFFGPAAMLMVLVSVRFFSALGDAQTGIFKGVVVAANSNVATDPTFFASMALFSIPIIMLWMAMSLAQTFSLVGASSVVGLGQKAFKWAGKVVLSPIPWGFRKYEKAMTTGKRKKFTKFLAPTAVYKGIEAWRKETHEEDKAPVERAAGAIQDKLNHLFHKHTEHEFAVKQHQAAKVSKEIAEISSNSEYGIEELKSFLKRKQYDGTFGAIKSLVKENNLNDVLTSLDAKEIEKYGLETHMITLKNADGTDRKDASGKVMTKEKVLINPMNFQKVLEGMLVEAGGEKGSEALAMDIMTISDLGTSSGNYGVGGLANFYLDEKTGKKKWRLSDANEQGDWAAAKVKNLESQDRQKKIHPDSIYDYYYDDDGKKVFTDLNTAGVKMTQTYTQGDVSEQKRSRDDNKQGMLALENLRQDKTGGEDHTPKRFKEALKANAVLNDYAVNMKQLFETKIGQKKSPEPKNSRKLPAPTTPPPDWTMTP